MATEMVLVDDPSRMLMSQRCETLLVDAMSGLQVCIRFESCHANLISIKPQKRGSIQKRPPACPGGQTDHNDKKYQGALLGISWCR